MPDFAPRTPIAKSPISAILFAHALDTDTSEVLQAWRRYLDTLNRSYEILLIRETRPELAAATATDIPEDTKRLHTFTYERNVGFRDALNSAIRAAQYPLLAFSPCDRQYAPNELDQLLKMIDQVDLVTCYRGGQAPPWRVLLDMFLSLASRIVIGVPLMKRVCWLGTRGRGRRWVARWIFGVRVLDPECPFRLARRKIFQHMPIQSSGPFVNVEILAKANHLTCLLAEEGVTWNAPTEPTSDAVSFATDAYLVFREPDFGPFPVSTTEPVPPQTTANPVLPPT